MKVDVYLAPYLVWALSLVAPLDPPSDGLVGAAKALGLARGYQRVADNPGNWWTLALEQDSTWTWPGGEMPALDCQVGSVKALECFAMTPPPEQAIIWLGHSPVALDPARLWRRRRHGKLATVIFARFPQCADKEKK